MDRLAEDKRVYKKEEDETKSEYLYKLGFTITLGLHLKIYIYTYIYSVLIYTGWKGIRSANRI